MHAEIVSPPRRPRKNSKGYRSSFNKYMSVKLQNKAIIIRLL